MTRIIQRNDISTNWTTSNPTLAIGEVGWETDTKKFKLGDGVTPWTSLEYVGTGESELDKYLSATTNDNTTTVNANGKVIKLDAPAIEVGENLVDNLGDNPNLYLKQNTVEAGTNVTIDKTATGIRINSTGGGESTSYNFQTPLTEEVGTATILLPTEEYTSNTVAGKYTITSNQSYHSNDAYTRFKEEVWDGNAYRNALTTASILTYTRTDGENFPTGEMIMNIPFVSYNCCIDNVVIKTYDTSDSELQSFTKTFEAIPLRTRTEYTIELDVTEPFTKFTMQLNQSSASGFDTSSQNRIGPVTFGKVTGVNTVGLSIDDTTLKVNSQGQLYAEQQEVPVPENMVTTDTDQEIEGNKTFTKPIIANQVKSNTGGINITPADNQTVLIGQNRAGILMLKGSAIRFNDRTKGGDTYITSPSNGVLMLGQTTSTSLNEVLTTNTAFKQVKLTQAEYDGLATKDENTLYIITDGSTSPIPGDYIVARSDPSLMPSYWVKYKSGWGEQGGHVPAGVTEIKYLRDFVDTNYILTQGLFSTDGASTTERSIAIEYISSPFTHASKTGFTKRATNTSGFDWVARGMIM